MRWKKVGFFFCCDTFQRSPEVVRSLSRVVVDEIYENWITEYWITDYFTLMFLIEGTIEPISSFSLKKNEAPIRTYIQNILMGHHDKGKLIFKLVLSK